MSEEKLYRDIDVTATRDAGGIITIGGGGTEVLAFGVADYAAFRRDLLGRMDGAARAAGWDVPGAAPTQPAMVASIISALQQVVPQLRPAVLAEMRGVPAGDLREAAGLLREIADEIGDVAGVVEGEWLISAWVERRDSDDPYDNSRLPGGPDPATCEHVWRPATRGEYAPYYCFRGCGSTQPDGFTPTGDELARSHTYDPVYKEVSRRHLERERKREDW